MKQIYTFTGIRSRLSIGQVKEIILHSESEDTRVQFLQILEKMLCQQIGWCQLGYKMDDE